jgi:rare lipoprotein A (peptidoglycan hydrolase)
VLALFSAVAMTASGGVAAAQEGGGGVAPPSDEPAPASGFQKLPFGARDLAKGMAGNDVKTLNWVMNAVSGRGPYNAYFESPTDSLVRSFQSTVGLTADGVVRRATRKRIASRMRNNLATWYGPGFWGNRTACGRTLRPRTTGVAHRRLPCGTKVVFAYRGNWVRAKVIDRGPYSGNYRWDLTRKAAKRLGFLATGAGRLKAAVVG